VNQNPVSVEGVIERNADVDVFHLQLRQLSKVRLTGGVQPGITNLDVRMQVRNRSNQLLLVDYSNDRFLEAVSEFTLQPGSYDITLRGDSAGNPYSGTPTGWTTYGSLGNYTLTILPDPPSRNNAIDNNAPLTDPILTQPWIVDTETTYDGEDALRAGPVSDNETAALRIQKQTTSVQFRYKVSSEQSFDFLEFYINNQLQGSWSGETGWAIYTNTSLANITHTFEWRYVKDGSFFEGSDTAWIDEVQFSNDVSYANWAAGTGASSDGSQDGNNNGVPDLSEYALVENLSAGNARGEILLAPTGPALEFYRDTTRKDLVHRIQISSDLDTWTTVAVS
jgi:hypothetical protein